jgi:hypothetical protein
VDAMHTRSERQHCGMQILTAKSIFPKTVPDQPPEHQKNDGYDLPVPLPDRDGGGESRYTRYR